jgi:hypothetical protein
VPRALAQPAAPRHKEDGVVPEGGGRAREGARAVRQPLGRARPSSARKGGEQRQEPLERDAAVQGFRGRRQREKGSGSVVIFPPRSFFPFERSPFIEK